MQQQPPDTPKPLYLWEDPPLPKDDAEEFITVRMPKKRYELMTQMIDIRPWKQHIERKRPKHSHLRKLAKTESDFVKRIEWDYTSVVYLALSMIETLELSEQKEISPMSHEQTAESPLKLRLMQKLQDSLKEKP